MKIENFTIMKNLFLVSVVFFTLVFFTGCDDDDNYPTRYYSSTGTFIKGDDSFYFKTDQGNVMALSSGSNLNEDDFSNDSTRALSVFYVEKEYSEGDIDSLINVTDYDEILTKSIFHFTSETEEDVKDSIGNDAIHIRDMWITDNYLTIYFSYYGGSEIHYINLVQDADSLESADGDLILEFKHNANSDNYGYNLSGFVSFDISELQSTDSSSISLLVRNIINSSGDYEDQTIVYSYGDDSDSTTEFLSKDQRNDYEISSDSENVKFK